MKMIWFQVSVFVSVVAARGSVTRWLPRNISVVDSVPLQCLTHACIAPLD